MRHCAVDRNSYWRRTVNETYVNEQWKHGWR